MIKQLRNDPQLSSQKIAIEALNDLELLFRYLTLFNVMDKVKNKKSQFFFKYYQTNQTISLDNI